jgi:hypothetical protein
VTAEIEAQLGRVLQQENTADYFAQEAQVHSETTLPAQSSTW